MMMITVQSIALVLLSILLITCTFHHHHHHRHSSSSSLYQYNHRQYHLYARNDYESPSKLSALATASNFITKNVLDSSIVKNITSSILNTITKNNNSNDDDDDDDNDEGQWRGKLIDKNINTNVNNTTDTINRGLWRGKSAVNTTDTTNTTSTTNTDSIIINNNNDKNNSNVTAGIARGILRVLGTPIRAITGTFKKKNNNNSSSSSSSSSIINSRVISSENTNNSEPKGILNIVGRSARRRLLNLFDRQTNWVKVVRNDDDDDDEGSKYISMPQIRKLKPYIDDSYISSSNDNTKVDSNNNILFRIARPITNLFKKDTTTTNSYSYYDQKNVRMLPSSQVRISDSKRIENKGVLSRIVGYFRTSSDKEKSDLTTLTDDAISTILSTAPNSKEIELVEKDKKLLPSMQGLSRRLNPFQRNGKTKVDSSVVSFSITKGQYPAPGPIEKIKITTTIETAPPTILQNVGNFGANVFNGLRSLVSPKSAVVVSSAPVSTETISTMPNILISNELSQQLTTNYQPKDKRTQEQEDLPIAPIKKRRVTVILQTLFPFVSKNIQRVFETGTLLETDLKKILNNTIVDVVDVGDLSTTTYFNNNGDIVDQNSFTLEPNTYNSTFFDNTRKVLSTIYDSWNLDAIGTYSDWAKQALFTRKSEQKSIVDDINSFKEADAAPIEIVTDVDASLPKPQVYPQVSPTIVRQSIPDINESEKYNKFERPIEFKTFTPIDRPVPKPTKADFAYIAFRRILIAVSASSFVSSERDVEVFLREIGLNSLLIAVTQAPPSQSPDLRLQALEGLNNLLQQDRKIVMDIVKEPNLINSLCDIIEVPLNMFRLRSQVDKDRDFKEQYQAISLIFKMVRISDAAADFLKEDVRLRKIMLQIASQSDDTQSAASKKGVILTPGEGSFPPMEVSSGSSKQENSLFGFGQRVERKKSSNSTIILDYSGMKIHQMCKIIVGAIGASQWKPKQPGQKGLRILSFDGGGTRGVLSVAIMRELCKRVGKNPHEIFDIICGTSTGGIVAVLMGAKKLSVAETEYLYDEFIDKVFGKKSSVKLVTEQASYDELEFENILSKQLGDEQFIDSVRNDCAKVFCVSTKVNTVPTTHIWRNYNYPPGQTSRYAGSNRVNTMTAVRATTAAPTFFVPVQWENGLYCDGALVANNPTAIALQEAKQLFPGVPIETVLSVGTGVFSQSSGNVNSMGWDLLISQVIAGAVDTEDIHELLRDLLPDDQYFRFNPKLVDNLNIDEKDKGRLNGLKNLALTLFDPSSRSLDAKRMEKLVNRLKK